MALLIGGEEGKAVGGMLQKAEGVGRCWMAWRHELGHGGLGKDGGKKGVNWLDGEGGGRGGGRGFDGGARPGLCM